MKIKLLLAIVISFFAVSSYAGVVYCPSSVSYDATAKLKALGWTIEAENEKFSSKFTSSARWEKKPFQRVYCYYERSVILSRIAGSGSEVCVPNGRKISCSVPPLNRSPIFDTKAKADASAKAVCANYKLGKYITPSYSVDGNTGKVGMKYNCEKLK